MPRASLLALDEGAGLQQAIKVELVPWALGYGDPVRGRVEAREREGLRRAGAISTAGRRQP